MFYLFFIAVVIPYCNGIWKPIYQVPNWLYYQHLSYDAHYELVNKNSLFPMMDGYTERHFWHQTSVVYLSLLNVPVLIRQPLENLINILRKPYIDSKTTDLQIDLDMMELFDTVLGDVLYRPKDLLPVMNLMRASSYMSLNQLYYNRLGTWGAPMCLIDIISRNYLIMMHQYLITLHFQNEYTVFRDLYVHLTAYAKFSQCGSMVFYSNLLTRIDTLFNARLLSTGVILK
ncbi:MAG: hypothetical protein EOP45_09950 [Sphingobacteriaceae bacterium]|nr:MAG: hypothetical protein EOP45_09950 [Sphingobacteriaceae bacterium]